jgi:uncharacterized delta-60 repeat protein
MKNIFTLLTLLLFSLISLAQPGSLDLSFNNSDIGNLNGNGDLNKVYSIKLQNDGKIIVGSRSGRYNGTMHGGVYRLNSDGKLDTSFNLTQFNTTNPYFSFIQAILIQNDGKILIGGRIFFNNETTSKNIVRLNIDGSIDTSFNSSYNTSSVGEIVFIEPQSNGKVIVGTRYKILRLNQDGSIDTTFNIGSGANQPIRTISLQADGKILIGGDFTSYNGISSNRIIRLNNDGDIDTSFNLGTGANNRINAITLQTDGKILIGGIFTSFNNVNSNRIVRLNNDGLLDPTFTIGTGTNSGINTITIQTDGQILIGGSFSSYNGNSTKMIARLNPNGVLDNTFNNLSVNYTVNIITCQGDGKIVLGLDNFDLYDGRRHLQRLNSDGSFDFTFNEITGASSGFIYSFLEQPDNKILLGGSFTTYNNSTCNGLVRVKNNGAIDPTFNLQLNLVLVKYIAFQSDKIIVAGGFVYNNGNTKRGIARLNSDGTIDHSFNISGNGLDLLSANEIKTLAIQNDGKIIIGGCFTSFNGNVFNNIARLNSDGSIDSSFNSGTGFNVISCADSINSIIILNDGKVLVGGSFNSYNGNSCRGIIKLNSDGSIDNSFLYGSGFNGYVHSIAIQSDGKILVGGNFTTYNGNSCIGIARLNTNGTFDNTFNTIGSGVNIGGIVNKVAIQGNGKIIIGGRFTSYNGNICNHIARLNNDGSYDNDFNTNGSGLSQLVGDPLRSLLIQNDGKIMIGGDFGSYNGIGRNRIARINGDNLLSYASFEKNEFIFSPNPTRDILNFKSTQTIEKLILINSLGQVVHEEFPNSKEGTINIGKLAQGTYIVKVNDSSKGYTIIKN